MLASRCDVSPTKFSPEMVCRGRQTRMERRGRDVPGRTILGDGGPSRPRGWPRARPMTHQQPSNEVVLRKSGCSGMRHDRLPVLWITEEGWRTSVSLPADRGAGRGWQGRGASRIDRESAMIGRDRDEIRPPVRGGLQGTGLVFEPDRVVPSRRRSSRPGCDPRPQGSASRRGRGEVERYRSSSGWESRGGSPDRTPPDPGDAGETSPRPS